MNRLSNAARDVVEQATLGFILHRAASDDVVMIRVHEAAALAIISITLLLRCYVLGLGTFSLRTLFAQADETGWTVLFRSTGCNGSDLSLSRTVSFIEHALPHPSRNFRTSR